MDFRLKKEIEMARKVIEAYPGQKWKRRRWQIGDRFYYEKDRSQDGKGEVILVDEKMLKRLELMQGLIGDSQALPFPGVIIWLPSKLQYMGMTGGQYNWHDRLTLGRGDNVYIERLEDARFITTKFADSPAEAWEKMHMEREKRKVTV